MSDESVRIVMATRGRGGQTALEDGPMREQAGQRRIESYLHENIPLSVAMGVCVRAAAPEHVLLSAPLQPNINHHETVFGGSAAVLATLAAWTLLHVRLQHAGLPAQLVIQRSSMEYEKPIPGDFEAECSFSDSGAWERFRTTLDRRGRARLTLTAHLLHKSQRMATFVGDFVALRSQ